MPDPWGQSAPGVPVGDAGNASSLARDRCPVEYVACCFPRRYMRLILLPVVQVAAIDYADYVDYTDYVDAPAA